MPGDHPDDSVADCVDDVMAQGHDESSAYAICEASINGKSDDLTRMLKDAGKDEWVPTVERMIENGTDQEIVQDVTDTVLKGRELAKSDSLEKVGFEAEVNSAPTIFKAENEFIIWGPASVEVVDKEGDKIHAKALSKALPQLLKRARLSLDHSDQLVGRILENFETEQPVEVEIDGRTFERSEFPTEVLELDKMEPALYVAGEIFADTRQAKEARQRIEDGDLNSYSISGEALVTRKQVESDGTVYNDVVDMDLSAVTLCEEGMNQHAEFAPISESGEKTAATTDGQTAKTDGTDEPGTTQARDGGQPAADAVASVAKTAVDDTMSANTNDGDAGGGLDLDALQAEFKSILDGKLPDGELATKSDMPDTVSREEVKSIAQEIYDEKQSEDPDDDGEYDEEAEEEPGPDRDADDGEKQQDVAGEEDDEDSGQSEDRPGDEADPTLENPEANEDGQDSGHSEDTEDARPGEEADPDMSDSKTEDEKADPAEKLADEFPALKADEINQILELANEKQAPAPEEEPAAPEESGAEPAPEEEPAPDEGGGGGGLTEEELEEKLPADVWEVVREYIGGDGPEADAEAAPVEASADEADAEATEKAAAMETAKSDSIEAAVENVLSGKGIMETGGADAPAGEVEKSYSDEEPSEAENGDHPALANFY